MFVKLIVDLSLLHTEQTVWSGIIFGCIDLWAFYCRWIQTLIFFCFTWQMAKRLMQIATAEGLQVNNVCIMLSWFINPF